MVQLVVLSDRISEEEMDIKQPPIPTLLAVGSVHHHLIRYVDNASWCLMQGLNKLLA